MTTDTVGGVWTFSRDLAEGLLCAGCSVFLVSLGRMPSESQEDSCAGLRATHGERFSYKPLDVPLEWMSENHGAYQLAAPSLLSISERFAPDLLHSNQFCFGALPISVPKLITAHSDVLSWAKGCRDGALEDTPWLHTYLALVQDGLSEAAAVAAPTFWMLRSLGETYVLPDKRHAIPNGCSVPAMANKSIKLQAITAGRLWDEGKSVSILEDVTSAMPLLIAGETAYDGTQSRGPDNGHCEFLGRIEHQELLEVFSQSAIYLCTSTYEPFGLAPLEAAMCGCAILARDIPSLREVWADGALYFSDAASLSNLLQRLYSDLPLLQHLRKRSRARAEEFSAARMTQTYLSLYQELTGAAASEAHAA